MKKYFLPVALIFLSLNLFAQYERNPFPKTITVAGSAELEVVPDEIYVQVILREYEKKGKGKIDIETIKREFLNHVKRVGIADSLISIAAYDGYNPYPWWRKKRKDELYASISYELKLKSSKQVDDIVNGLDDEATQDFFIQRTSVSRLPELRKQLKIAAVKAAKEKAEYLSAAINEKVGEAVNINEPHEYYVPYYNVRRSNVMNQEKASSVDMASAPEPVDFRKIKLRYDVTVVFALK